MQSTVLSVTLVVLFAAVALGGVIKKAHPDVIVKDGNSTAIHSNATTDATDVHIKPSSFRTARQIGYGGQYGGLQSQLSGISSGYGYGYNNAVGLGGVGQSAGSNLGVFPGIGFFGRR